MQMQPMMAAYYPSNVTTDHIQQVLHFSSLLLLSAYLPFTLCLFASLPAAAAAAVSHSVGLSAI